MGARSAVKMTGKKLLSFLLVVVAAIVLVGGLDGCSSLGGSQTTQNDSTSDNAYTVVSIDAGTTPKDYFAFTSVGQVAVADFATGAPANSRGVSATPVAYSVGHLEDGNTVVWESGNASTFVYIEGNLTTNEASVYASKLEEDPIPYSEFESTRE